MYANLTLSTILVLNTISYYRGHWYPFCINYTKTSQTLTGTISAAGGKRVIVKAEVPEHLDSFRKSTGYTESAILDPENVFAKELKRRGLLHIAISEMSGYAHGMV